MTKVSMLGRVQYDVVVDTNRFIIVTVHRRCVLRDWFVRGCAGVDEQ